MIRNVVLTELVEKLESGTREKGGSVASGIISIGATQLSNTGGFKWDKKDFVSRTFYSKMKNGKIQKNDILLVKDGATTGKVSFITHDFPHDEAAINEHVFRIKINYNIANPKFVFYFLFSPKGQEQILSDFRGTTIGGISRGFIDKVSIPLPDLETQSKIVETLDKVKSLLEKRDETLSLTNKLLLAKFQEIFGDPMERPNRWVINRIGDFIIEIKSGVSYGGQDRKQLEEDELGVLKISSVTKGIFNPLEYKAINIKNIKKAIIKPKKGDLLFSRANTIDFVGATCLVDKDYDNLFLPDKLWRVETDENILNKVYLHYALQNKNVRETFLSIATGSSGSMLNISMEKFRNIQLPIPPIELQNDFVHLYNHCYSIINKLNKSKSELEHLQKSLSQSAFAGRSQYDIDIEITAILNSFELRPIKWSEKKAAVIGYYKIISDVTYLQRIIDKIEEQEYEELEMYQKAQSIIFIALIKEGNLVKQKFDEKLRLIKLSL